MTAVLFRICSSPHGTFLFPFQSWNFKHWVSVLLKSTDLFSEKGCSLNPLTSHPGKLLNRFASLSAEDNWCSDLWSWPAGPTSSSPWPWPSAVLLGAVGKQRLSHPICPFPCQGPLVIKQMRDSGLFVPFPKSNYNMQVWKQGDQRDLNTNRVEEKWTVKQMSWPRAHGSWNHSQVPDFHLQDQKCFFLGSPPLILLLLCPQAQVEISICLADNLFCFNYNHLGPRTQIIFSLGFQIRLFIRLSYLSSYLILLFFPPSTWRKGMNSLRF